MSRLTQVVSGTLTTQFAYNGAGDRVAKTVDGVTTDYMLDGSTGLTTGPAAGLTQVLVESTGGQQTAYLYGHDLLTQYDSGTWAYHVNDGLGSVRQLAGVDGQVTLAQSYDPFGNVLERVGTGQSGFGYTGEQEDPGTELVFLRARYYAPGIGRFLTKDPWPGSELRPQSMNGWSYVEGNPVNWVDPTGYQVECDDQGYCPEIDRYLCGPNTPGGYDSRGLPCIANPENVQRGSTPASAPALAPPVLSPCIPTSPTDTSWKFCQDDRDLTNWLYRELMDAVTGPEVKTLRTLYHSPSFPLALEGWASLVRDKHRWDFKHRIREEFGSEIILFRQSDYTPYSAEYSVPGNIFYGYVGSAIGFEGWLLHAGAGYAEGTDPAHIGDPNRLVVHVCDREFGFYFNPKWIGTLNDDPDDYRVAEFGIQLWNRYKETMTESQFVQELEQNHHQFALPPVEYGGNAYGWRNPQGTWPYPVGYFNGWKPSWLFDGSDPSGLFD